MTRPSVSHTKAAGRVRSLPSGSSIPLLRMTAKALLSASFIRKRSDGASLTRSARRAAPSLSLSKQ